MNLFLALVGIAVILMVCSMMFSGNDSQHKILSTGNIMGTAFTILVVAVFSLYAGI